VTQNVLVPLTKRNMTSMVNDLTRDIFAAENSDEINDNNNNNNNSPDAPLKPSKNKIELGTRRNYIDDDLSAIENTLKEENTKTRTPATSKRTKKSGKLYRKEAISNHTETHEEESRQMLDKDIVDIGFNKKNDTSDTIGSNKKNETIFNKDIFADKNNNSPALMPNKDVLVSETSGETQDGNVIHEKSLGGPIIQNKRDKPKKSKKSKTWYKEFTIHTNNQPIREDSEDGVGQQITDNMMTNETRDDETKTQADDDDLVTVRGGGDLENLFRKVCLLFLSHNDSR